MSDSLKVPFLKGTRIYDLYLIFLKHAKELNKEYIPNEEWAIKETEKWKTELKSNQQKGAQ